MKQYPRCLAAVPMAAAIAMASLGFSGTAGASTASDGSDSFLSYSGTATQEKPDKFLYRENHVLQMRGGNIEKRVVLYTCQDGTAFARKTVSYDDALAPDFLLEDASNGMREGIRTDGSVRKVFFQGDRLGTVKTSPLPNTAGLVADSGFDAFVRANWQSLIEGHTLAMNFVVPSHLTDMGFKVAHVRSDHVDGAPVEVFRLKVSGVVGWVAPSIDVYYGATDRTLIRYVGLSDLRNESMDNYQAAIDFPASARRGGDEHDMTAALQARLAPCQH